MNNMLLVELIKKRLVDYESFLSLVPEFQDIYGISLENMESDDLKVLALGLHIDINNNTNDNSQISQKKQSKRKFEITKTEDLEEIIEKCQYEYFLYGVGINRVQDWLHEYKISPKPEYELFIRINLFVDLFLIFNSYFQIECDEKFAMFLIQLEKSAQNYMTVIDRSNYQKIIYEGEKAAISYRDIFALSAEIDSIYKAESDQILKFVSEVWDKLKLISAKGSKDKQLLLIVVIDIFGDLLNRNLSGTGSLYYEMSFVYDAEPFINDYGEEEFFEWIIEEVSISIEEYGKPIAENILDI
ncbi:hypothetical protein [Fusibacter tunisiensis]|uniref:Uncharacterized protein n=1 Tax=Fusibacter tunisiensis TaxID=1008308 RepID=A0ABS2MTH4_9FIRM|nr:hypothetical protein [Fusibacter tunisiensis]MBM7562711.1 hypothetical protein [Fusibacter tunisiensis]